MARVSYTDHGGSPFRRLLGHNPALLEAFAALSAAIPGRLTLPAELVEELRRHQAGQIGCRY